MLFEDGKSTFKKNEINNLGNPKLPLDEKSEVVYEMKGIVKKSKAEYNDSLYSSKQRINELEHMKRKLENEIKDLHNKKLLYPDNTVKLRDAIMEELRVI